MPPAIFSTRIIQMAKKSKKKHEEKITYIDDGSTIADMSALDGRPKNSEKLPLGRNSFGDKVATYFAAVKKMFGPMLWTILGICVVFGIIYLILCIAEANMTAALPGASSLL